MSCAVDRQVTVIKSVGTRSVVCCGVSCTKNSHHPVQTLKGSCDHPAGREFICDIERRSRQHMPSSYFCSHTIQACPTWHDINRKKKTRYLPVCYNMYKSKPSLVKRTVCPHELAVPLLDLLQACQALAWLASLSSAERTGCRDLHTLCCVTSALLGNLLSLAAST